MDRHPVPQNIMEVEFKLFGALTVRQFGYLAGGLILSLLIFFTGIPTILKFVLMLISSVLGLFLGLVKINGQSSSVWLTNFIIAMFTSQERVWKKTGVVPEVFQEKVQKTREETLMKAKKEGGVKASVTPLTKFESAPSNLKVDSEEESRLSEISKQFNETTSNVKTENSIQSAIIVQGNIFDKTDKPIEGALVSINQENGSFVAESVSDATGYFRVDKALEEGVYFAGITAENNKFDYYKLRLRQGQDILYKFKAK